MKCSIFYPILILCISAKVEANVPPIEAYQKGNFELSKSLWNQEIKKEGASASSYFHLGNTYMKLEDYSQAILMYEKSLLLDYNNEDVKFNIKVARAKLGLDVDHKELFLSDWMKKATYTFSNGLYKWLIIVLLWVLAIMIYMVRWRGMQAWRYAPKILIGAILVLSIGAVAKRVYSSGGKHAIIMKDDTKGFQNVTLQGKSTELREGTRVIILDEVEKSVQVRTDLDSTFWIDRASINII